MKLVELIKYLVKPESLDSLYKEKKLDVESDALLIYMKDILNIDSEIFIFEVEKTEDELIYENEGVTYIQLFPLNHAIDLIEYDLQLKDKGYSELQIAERLLDYRLNDA